MTIFAERFADQSLPVVPHDGVANLAADRKPEPARAIAVLERRNDQRAVGRIAIASVNGLEFGLLSQTGGSGEALPVSTIRIPTLRLAHV